MTHRIRPLTVAYMLLALGSATAATADEWDQRRYRASQAPVGNHAHFAPSPAPFRWGYFGAQAFQPRNKWTCTYYREPMVWNSFRQY